MKLAIVLLALLAFQGKHFLCDFVLQNKWQIESKKTYLGAGGLVHAALHAGFSIPALLILAAPPSVLAAIVAFEFVLHYHVDWAKARIDTRAGWSNADLGYWIVFGVDQFVHQLTYLGFAAFLAGVF